MRLETRLLKLESDVVSSQFRVGLPNVALPCVCINPFSGSPLLYASLLFPGTEGKPRVIK